MVPTAVFLQGPFGALFVVLNYLVVVIANWFFGLLVLTEYSEFQHVTPPLIIVEAICLY